MLVPKIIYEDDNFLAVNKPAGLLVHGVRGMGGRNQEPGTRDMGQGTWHRGTLTEPTLVDWLLRKYPQIAAVGDDPEQRPGIVHRLDKDTSGVLLVAKNQKTFAYLKSLFQKHEVKKTYLAVVWGVPKEMSGVIDAPIGIQNGTMKRSVRSRKMAKEAVTEWKMVRKWEGTGNQEPGTRDEGRETILAPGSRSPVFSPWSPISLLEIHPQTGRTHQIRVHLASMGHPVVGDPLYGKERGMRGKGQGTRDQELGTRDMEPGTRKRIGTQFISPRPQSQVPSPGLLLHALSLEFTAPDGKRMRLEAEPPKEWEGIAVRDQGPGTRN